MGVDVGISKNKAKTIIKIIFAMLANDAGTAVTICFTSAHK